MKQLNNGWKENKRWSDKFLPLIKRILGEILIGEPPVMDDQERNTDLMVLKLDAVRIACRIRKHEYLEKYGDQFTIRATLPSGTKTELTKIIEGWGDYFFYGFSNEDETRLERWILGDLKAFRIWFVRGIKNNKGICPGISLNNNDNSSRFLAFEYKDIPNFVIAKQI